LTNLNAVSYVLARIILQFIKFFKKLAHHFNIVKWRLRHIWRYQKRRLQTFNKNFSKRKTWHCKSIAKKCANRNWSRRWL